MTQLSSLLDSLQQAINRRSKGGLKIYDLDEPLPSHAPDFFSNDYLSLSTDSILKDDFLRKVQSAPPTRLLGSTGSRLGTGNSSECSALEKAFERFFESPSVMLFGSGFSANMAFLGTIPQKGDVVIWDELIHSSCREGIRLSSRTSYRFAHNSAASFRDCLLDVLEKHPEIILGSSTVFIVVESLYSMDGDFCPLQEIVDLVESLVPAGHAHIMVDEAHTSGLFGPNGTGYVAHLGLNDSVHTKIHTFGKAWGYHGAVVLTSPIIRHYMINFAKSIMFSTSMPYTDIYALESCLGVVSSAHGQEASRADLVSILGVLITDLFPIYRRHTYIPHVLKQLRQNLHRLSRYARKQLFVALKSFPSTLITLQPTGTVASKNVDTNASTTDVSTSAISDHFDLCSPVIPVFTPHARGLADYLLQRGYGVSPMMFPVVKQPRIRVIIHAGNTVEEIDAFIGELITWAVKERAQQEGDGMVYETEDSSSGSERGGAGRNVERRYSEVRARL